jgi:cyanophycin synthetase
VLARVEDVPLAFGGAAVHNVANALAAAAVAWGLGVPDEAVSRALETFGGRAADNPGRGHLVRLPSGVGVLLDFGHNAAGLRAASGLARSLLGPRGRLLVVATQPGDRTAADFAALAREIALASPRLTVLWESDAYMRGRARGEVAHGLRAALRKAGMASRAITLAEGEMQAIDRALEVARRGDIVLVAPHIDRAAVDDGLMLRSPLA